jgi:hypothetical protein
MEPIVRIFKYHYTPSDLYGYLDAKLHGHAETSMKRRDPTIMRLTKNYNDLCRQLVLLIRQKKAPAGAIQPQEIPREGLFKLDVDDEIWQDADLDSDHYGAPPLWLSDERVRKGIRSLLEVDRCKEEEVRLRRERCALQEWALEEWNVINIAQNTAGMNQFILNKFVFKLLQVNLKILILLISLSYGLKNYVDLLLFGSDKYGLYLVANIFLHGDHLR